MGDPSDKSSSPLGMTPSEMFPALTPAQQGRVLAHGAQRGAETNEVLIEFNKHATKFFVVVTGQLHILQVSNGQENVAAVCNPGMFTGELNVLTGRRGLVRIRASKRSELIAIEREALLELVQTDSELSDIGGNVKRVASAVGEGSIAVSYVHQALAD